MLRAPVRHASAWLAWALTFWGFWLLLVHTYAHVEMWAGAGAAAIAAVGAETVRTHADLRYRLEPRSVLRAWKQPLQIFLDFGVLVLALRQGRPHGAFRATPFPAGGDDATSRGRRAFATMAGTLAPNTIVVDVDPERDLMLVHELVPERASERPL